MAVIQAVKGTRDFYPEEKQVQTWLYRTLRRVSESFGYQEYETPYLETLELYAAKSGDELVKEQAFVFPDRGGNMITLRPELTPSLARMMAQRQRQLIYPLRWWSFGPMWRYERPQKGRTREFFQWNIDLIGAESPEADAEMAAIGATFFREVGLRPDQIQILVNNRRLIAAELRALGIAPARSPDVFRLIDRRDKLSAAAWATYAKELGLDDVQFNGIIAMLENEDLWQKSEELQRFFAAIDTFGVADYIHFAPHIIRGLDYYTGTVFEAWDQDGEFRAILGGGRYDNLVAAVGGDPLPGVGFAMGDVVISLVLEKFGCIPSASELAPAPVLVTVFDETTLLPSLQFATELRQGGLSVAVYPQTDKLGKQLKYAGRIASPIAVIMGPDEVTQGVVTVKNLRDRTQYTLARSEAAQKISHLLGGFS
ncbi:MAG: histidine--tRNA ligase [Anaerolineae bacterium]|nr:histidine--tRNA ligase [Anaerolineae bacterium]